MKLQTFTNIVKEAITDSRFVRDSTVGDAVEVVDKDKNKIIYSQQVLVVKPREGVTANAAKIAAATKRIEGVLCSI